MRGLFDAEGLRIGCAFGALAAVCVCVVVVAAWTEAERYRQETGWRVSVVKSLWDDQWVGGKRSYLMEEGICGDVEQKGGE